MWAADNPRWGLHMYDEARCKGEALHRRIIICKWRDQYNQKAMNTNSLKYFIRVSIPGRTSNQIGQICSAFDDLSPVVMNTNACVLQTRAII